MIDDIQKLIDKYAVWLKEKTDLRQIEDYVEITTPFLDRHNDHIQLYVKKQNGSYILTDDGYTLNDLSVSGCDIDTAKRKQLLVQALNGYGVERKGNAITVKADERDFPQMKHNLLQAVLAVNDLFYTSSPVVQSLFLEDVQSWLDLNDIRYTPKISFVGKSGFSHHYDFIIPKSKFQPERVLRAITNPERSIIQNLLFSWHDTAIVRPQESCLYAILNDSDGLKDNSLNALDNYGIIALPWSKKDQFKEKLAS